ncbi:hypothetical protein [Candidatus Thalassolituus haligoni]|uniref:hypothetical protein n=1 Tax=Candidatus Thalassolituus haligoni TaxID=3100113 RepID=UPI003516E945
MLTKALALSVGLVSVATAAPIQLRMGPADTYPVSTDIPSDTALIPLKRQLDWLYVQAGEYQGWISIDSLEALPENIKRLEPLQFRDNSDENNPQFELAATSETALTLGANFILFDQAAAVRITRSTDTNDDWYSLEAGKRFPFAENGRWSWDGYLGVGVGKSSGGSTRWDDEGDDTTVPLLSATTDINWNIAYNVSIGGRVQVQQALSGNSANHGALALVWKIRF